MVALKDAAFETGCMSLDLADAMRCERDAEKLAAHLNAAIRRHALIAHHLRSALTQVTRRRQVLSMTYPANLGGGHGPERQP